MRTAMPCPVGRHESAIPCAPSTDPAGLSTAHIGPQEQKPREISLLQTAHIKGLPTSLPLLGGLCLLSPSRRPRRGTTGVLLCVAVEVLETE
jgi:hypothetical protein